MVSKRDRIIGSILGALVGDALGLGPHWYYDLDELRREFGDWIDDYVEPRPGRYHAGCKAGDVSQTGQVMGILLESVSERGGYVDQDFCSRVDELLGELDGKPHGGRYTDEAMRAVWKSRKNGVPWHHAGSFANTAEAAIRMPVLAGRFAGDLPKAYTAMDGNIRLTHQDPQITGISLAFGLIVHALINGTAFADVPKTLRWQLSQDGLPLVSPSSCHCPGDPPGAGFIDVILQPAWSVEAARDPALRIEPASRACRIFGLACPIWSLLLGAFYLVARFEDDFEQAVLSAINGGGNNMGRAALAGALSGAMNGLSGIPRRLVEGLRGHEIYLDQAEIVAKAAGS